MTNETNKKGGISEIIEIRMVEQNGKRFVITEFCGTNALSDALVEGLRTRAAAENGGKGKNRRGGRRTRRGPGEPSK